MSKYPMLHHPLRNHRTAFGLVFLAIVAFVGGLILAPYLIGMWMSLAVQIAPLTATTDHLTSSPTLPKMEADVLTAYENALVTIYEKTVHSVVKIEVTWITDPESSRQGQGSGFVWDRAGHIVTNNHVIQETEHIQVVFANGTRTEAEVIGTDVSTDLAVLQVQLDPAQLQPVTLGDSTTVKVGQLALAIGTPFGQESTMTSGIISAVGRTISVCQSCYPIPEIIQMDTPINRGNSGGPLFNQRGEVIGINTLIIGRNGFNTGVAFAVPSHIITQIVPALISDDD